MLRAESESELNVKFLLSWGHTALLASMYDNTHGVLPARVLTWALRSKVFIGASFCSMTNGPFDWTQSPGWLILHDPKLTPKSHIAFSDVASPQPKVVRGGQPPPSTKILPSGMRSFPSVSDDKESACNAGDLGLIPRLGRSPGERKGYPLQYSCLEDSTDRGTWQSKVHGVAKSQGMTERLTLSISGMTEITFQKPRAKANPLFGESHISTIHCYFKIKIKNYFWSQLSQRVASHWLQCFLKHFVLHLRLVCEWRRIKFPLSFAKFLIPKSRIFVCLFSSSKTFYFRCTILKMKQIAVKNVEIVCYSKSIRIMYSIEKGINFYPFHYWQLFEINFVIFEMIQHT